MFLNPPELNPPEFLLFSQHGWADDNRAMTELAKRVASETALIIAPDLGYVETWLRIKPLIDLVEQVATQQLQTYPEAPLRILGHSMGGLIWLEVLDRHPEWWSRVHSLVLIASPVGGADLGRLLDPLGVGLGIARDLGMNRKAIAERIASEIPMLTIAGDWLGMGGDGTIPVEATKVHNARFLCLNGLSHPAMRNHEAIAVVIRDFWKDFNIGETVVFDDVMRQIHATPGMTDGHYRDFEKAKTVVQLQNGGTVRYWINPLGIEHVFVASAEGECLYAGFVGWLHSNDLREAIAQIHETHGIAPSSEILS
jgi:pimeloyl-ACP methyl ester carboxylesterase